ncbi:MAG: hypothetical protein KC613_10710, partial [Myxococcales bacterium]|nr:hypothetical protein [Myxococcales bacterium]
MRLGDVLDEPEPPAPPSKRRRRWIAPLVAVGGLAAFLGVHGPGVHYLEGGDAALVRGWPQDDVRVVTEEGLVFWLPLAQTLTLVPTAPRRLRLSVAGALRDGTPVTAAPLEASWQAKAQDLPALIR